MGNIIPKVSIEESDNFKCDQIMAELTSLRIKKYQLEHKLDEANRVITDRDDMYIVLQDKYNNDFEQHKTMIADLKLEMSQIKTNYDKVKHDNVTLIGKMQSLQNKCNKILLKLETICSTKLVNKYLKDHNTAWLDDVFERKMLLEFHQFLIDHANQI